jgi:hypothetical protein
MAVQDEHTKYWLGSVLNHVLMHQTIIGQEAIKQLEYAGYFSGYCCCAFKAAVLILPALLFLSCTTSIGRQESVPYCGRRSIRN